MINKMNLKINENDLKWLKISKRHKNDKKDIIFCVNFMAWHGSTAHIYFYQYKCTHKKSYLIQHCCSRQPPTCSDYLKLGNACCRKAHFFYREKLLSYIYIVESHVPFHPHLRGTQRILDGFRFDFNCRPYPIITNYMAYGTRRSNVTLTRAL